MTLVVSALENDELLTVTPLETKFATGPCRFFMRVLNEIVRNSFHYKILYAMPGIIETEDIDDLRFNQCKPFIFIMKLKTNHKV